MHNIIDLLSFIMISYLALFVPLFISQSFIVTLSCGLSLLVSHIVLISQSLIVLYLLVSHSLSITLYLSVPHRLSLYQSLIDLVSIYRGVQNIGISNYCSIELETVVYFAR